MTDTKFQNTLYTQDNLFVLYGMNSEMVDLIYLDPPFNSKRMYAAPVGSKAAGSSFKDMWTWEDVNIHYLEALAQKHAALAKIIFNVAQIHSKAMAAYLTYMAQRIIEMHRILKDTGSIYLHCDPTASHYLKLIMDDIFGKNNFRNEIAWCYATPSGVAKQFPRKHDVILYYAKSDNTFFNTQRIPHKSGLHNTGQSWNNRNDDNEHVRNLESQGKKVEDWWIDIYPVDRLRKERVGYPTQKPLALLHRIIKASSNEGDIVFDPFCGCATACVAAQQLGRKWIGIDIADQSARILIDRLSDDAGLFKDFIATTRIPQRTDVEIIEPQTSIKQRLYKDQEGKCNGCKLDFNMHNLEIDHYIPKSKGGGDYYENYQLLCGSCNRIKGDRPMEYLLLSIEARTKTLSELLFE